MTELLLPDDGGKLALRYGFVRGDDSELLLDYDYYEEGELTMTSPSACAATITESMPLLPGVFT